MGLKGLIKWAMEQQLRFFKEEKIEEFGKSFLKNIDEELGIDEVEALEETEKRITP